MSRISRRLPLAVKLLVVGLVAVAPLTQGCVGSAAAQGNRIASALPQVGTGFSGGAARTPSSGDMVEVASASASVSGDVLGQGGVTKEGTLEKADVAGTGETKLTKAENAARLAEKLDNAPISKEELDALERTNAASSVVEAEGVAANAGGGPLGPFMRAGARIRDGFLTLVNGLMPRR